MFKKFLQFIEDFKLISKNDSIIISFSGGADSIFLLEFLLKIKDKFALNLALFHLNHCLRGEESVRDENFSKKVAKRKGIPIIIERVDVKNFARENKLSLEEAGRHLRYSILNKVLNENKFNKIATGHNYDDQIETFFISLLKGRGVKAFEGIKVKRDKIIRPILIFKKFEIEEYLKENSIEYIFDSSNLSKNFLRNKIRLELIPFLEENFSNNFKKNIFEFSKQMSHLNIFIEDRVSEMFNSLIYKEKDGFRLDYKKLPENNFIRFEIYKKIFSKFSNYNYSQKILLEVDKFVKNSKGRFIFKNICFFKEYNSIFITDKSQTRKGEEITICKLGEYKIKNNQKIKLTRVDKFIINSKNSYLEFFDFNKIKFPLYIRYFQNGDRFTPLGLDREQKLKKFFINNKIPERVREEIPLLIDKNGEIIWVIGYRISNKVKVGNLSKDFLKCEVIFY